MCDELNFDCRRTNKRKYFIYARIVSRAGHTLSVSSNSYTFHFNGKVYGLSG